MTIGSLQLVDEEIARREAKGSSLRRALRVGCLLVVVGLCAGVGAIAAALQSGPVAIKIPGEGLLKIGSDDFVMSNYSFQNGATYYLDLEGRGVRNIVQLHYMEDNRRLELVFHQASKETMRDTTLFTMPVP